MKIRIYLDIQQSDIENKDIIYEKVISALSEIEKEYDRRLND